MKTILVLMLAAVILVGGWYLYTESQTQSDSNTAPETEQTTQFETETDKDTGPDLVSSGNDAGMEFPTADIDLPVDGNARVFNISGVNHDFDLKEIRVKEGETVTINFVSETGFHDWVLDEFNTATARVNAGGSSSVTFVADQKGTFEYYCSVGNHRAEGMVGTFIVE